jgi:phospholipase C
VRYARYPLIAALALGGCSAGMASGSPSGSFANPRIAPPPVGQRARIRHVVIVFQENRTVDNLFNGFPGADTVRSGLNSHGQSVALRPIGLTAHYDISHEHGAFAVERANGKLDGFNQVNSNCQIGRTCPPKFLRAYGYVPKNEVRPYFTMAQRYAFADRMFQTNEGPSFPAHQYILSGTSTTGDGAPLRAAGNPFSPFGGFTGGCDSPGGSWVWLIDPMGNENQATYPCFDRLALSDLLERTSHTWRYYQAHLGAGLWEGPDAIAHIRNDKSFAAHVVAPPKRVLDDIDAGRLADVVWVTPTAAASDHAGTTDGSGPSWVASVVNAIGSSKYWNDTAIFVTWDDWGGWYDHVSPPQYNSYELGFRVPLIVISPYAKRHYVSHRRHEFGSILKFTEETFDLGSMNTTDLRSDDLYDCFDFSQSPSRFQKIDAPLPRSYFERRPISQENPD